MLGPRRRIEFPCYLRVQDPKLIFDGRAFICGKRCAPNHFGHKLDVVVGLLQERANFVSKRRLADAVCANQCKFQEMSYLGRHSSSTSFCRV